MTTMQSLMSDHDFLAALDSVDVDDLSVGDGAHFVYDSKYSDDDQVVRGRAIGRAEDDTLWFLEPAEDKSGSGRRLFTVDGEMLVRHSASGRSFTREGAVAGHIPAALNAQDLGEIISLIPASVDASRDRGRGDRPFGHGGFSPYDSDLPSRAYMPRHTAAVITRLEAEGGQSVREAHGDFDIPERRDLTHSANCMRRARSIADCLAWLDEWETDGGRSVEDVFGEFGDRPGHTYDLGVRNPFCGNGFLAAIERSFGRLFGDGAEEVMG